MLKMFRSMVASWIAKILIGLLVLSFAVWGIGDTFTNTLHSSVASVGKTKVMTEDFVRSFNQRLAAVSRQLRRPVEIEEARQFGLDQSVLQQLTQRAAFDEEARLNRIDAPDEAVREAIRQDEVFAGATNEFDLRVYQDALRRAGFSELEYEGRVRSDIAREQLLNAITSGISTPRSPAEAVARFEQEKRIINYFRVDTSMIDPVGDPAQTVLEDFYKEREEAFTEAERRSISVVALSADTLAKPDEIDEEDLKAEFALRASSYQTVEKRNLEQIIFATRKQAEEARKRVEDGTIFSQIAAEKNLNNADIALGYVARDELPAAVGDAVFALTEDGLAGPVDTGTGFALINLRGIREAENRTLEDVRQMLAHEMALEIARDHVIDLSEQARELLDEGEPLDAIADTLELELVQTEAFDRQGLTEDRRNLSEIPLSGAFYNAVFALDAAENSPEIFEAAEGAFYLFRLDNITEARLKEFDSVREDVAAQWRIEAEKEAMASKAEEYAATLSEGVTMTSISEKTGLKIGIFGPGTRIEVTDDLPNALLSKLFNLMSGETTFGPNRTGETWTVATIQQIIPADLSESDETLTLQLDQTKAEMEADLLVLFTQAALTRHETVTRAAAIDAALHSYGNR